MEQMNMTRQNNKGLAAFTVATNEGKTSKAAYIRHCIELMNDSAQNGRPLPWSHFVPMIAEEFDEVDALEDLANKMAAAMHGAWSDLVREEFE